MTLRSRLDKLETATAGAATVFDAIDRPPQETREQWIARQAGLSLRDPEPLNSRGETRKQWIARRQCELSQELDQ